MKKIKMTKRVQIILITLLMLVIGGIIIFGTSNNKVAAYENGSSCPNCSNGIAVVAGQITPAGSGYHAQKLFCNKACGWAGYAASTKTACTNFGPYADKPTKDHHTKYCTVCKGGKWFSHFDNDGDEICDQAGCGYEMHSHSYSEKTYNSINDSEHSITRRCSCGDTQDGGTESHSYGSWKDNGNGTHSTTCSKCKHKKTASHEGATHPEGKCTVCQAVYETHSQSETIKEYKTTGTGHTPVYTCTQAGCTGTYDGQEEAHTGATHEDGKCTVCDDIYEKHGQSTNIKEYKTTETGHTPVYTCIQSGCETTYDGTEEVHTGATHEDGKCTVCQKVYEVHSQSETIKEYKITETGHTPVYTCTHEGCEATYDGTEVAHTGATHANGGKCTVCQEIYETHSQSETIKEYKTTETGHTPVYTCTHEGCETTYDGTEEAHTGATHEDGKCTVCQEIYETHGQSETIKEYKKTETGHIPVYICTHEGCEATYDGQEEEHKGATHEDGKCTVCQEVYETHGQSETMKEYKKTETGHTPVYECTHDGCEKTYDGTEEAHNFVDGVCTVCGFEENQEIDITSDEYEIDDEYISGIQPGVTPDELKTNMETNATEVNIYSKDNELLNDDVKLGTGMRVELKRGNTTKEFMIIIKGDIDGNGDVEMPDMSSVNRYRLGKKDLEEIYTRAADVTGDGEVDFKDIVKINRFRLSKITEL